jgi:hypothetical protein
LKDDARQAEEDFMDTSLRHRSRSSSSQCDDNEAVVSSEAMSLCKLYLLAQHNNDNNNNNMMNFMSSSPPSSNPPPVIYARVSTTSSSQAEGYVDQHPKVKVEPLFANLSNGKSNPHSTMNANNTQSSTLEMKTKDDDIIPPHIIGEESSIMSYSHEEDLDDDKLGMMLIIPCDEKVILRRSKSL